jgi:ubiquinone/menaquinone biosynthesis C-methylase UbiE
MGTIGKLMRPQNDPHGINGWIDARVMPSSHGPLYAKAVELLDLKPEDDLLEVACGVGALLQRHAGQVRYVAGLDHSQMQVGYARQRLTDRIAAGTAEVVLGDAIALPWQDERFTAVVCLNGLEVMPEPQKALSEMHRVLRPGGRAVLTMGMRFTDLKTQKKFADLKFWAPTETEATATVHDAGFADLEVTYFKEGSGMLDSLASWLSRTLFGSDEMRLVRAVAVA